MKVLWTSIFLLFNGITPCIGVPCWQIGLPAGTETNYPLVSWDNNVNVPLLDPFLANQGFDIVDITQCYFRFQTPRGDAPTDIPSFQACQHDGMKQNSCTALQADLL